MKKSLVLILIALMVMTMMFTGCSSSSSTTASDSSDAVDTVDDEAEGGVDTSLVYAVESGSAGEEMAIELGLEYNAVASQADALLEVASGTSDAAIIDLLLAGAMIGEGTSYPNMVYTEALNSEKNGAGCRKGSDLASYINAVLYEAYTDGSMLEIATIYGVQEAILAQEACEFVADEEDSDVEYIQSKGTLIVGVTDYAPMDYRDDNGEWVGFDADMAKLVAEKLGVEIEFVEIDWDNKSFEVNAGNVDVIWNGMSLTTENAEVMECTNAYCDNAQVIIMNAE